MTQTNITEDAAGMQSLADAERQSVSDGDAENSPETDEPYNSNVVYLSADPEQLQLQQEILAELQTVINNQTAFMEDQVAFQEEQLALLQEQTEQLQNGFIVNSMFLGFIAGAILILGLWRIKH